MKRVIAWLRRPSSPRRHGATPGSCTVSILRTLGSAGHTTIPCDSRRCFLIEIPIEADKAEGRLLLEAPGKTVRVDPPQLVPLPACRVILDTIPVVLPPGPGVLPARIALKPRPLAPSLSAPERPVGLDKIGRRQRSLPGRIERRRRREFESFRGAGPEQGRRARGARVQRRVHAVASRGRRASLEMISRAMLRQNWECQSCRAGGRRAPLALKSFSYHRRHA
jgi:hypothetical protein